MHRLSLVVGSGAALCCVQGLLLLWLLLLWSTLSRHMDLRPTGLTAPRHVESSWSWDWAHVPHMGRQIPNQWTSREALLQAFCPLIYLCLIKGQLQYCDGFCHTSTWISHSYTYVPSTGKSFNPGILCSRSCPCRSGHNVPLSP